MEDTISLRPMLSNDGHGLAELLSASPDTGHIQTVPIFKCDPLFDYYPRSGEIEGIVAETSEPHIIAGAGLIRYGQCNYEGSLKFYAYLHALAVRPKFRRKGIGTKLVQSLILRARERIDQAGVMLAFIQSKNKGSLSTFRSLPQQLKGRLIVIAISKVKQPPSPMKGIEIDTLKNRYLENVVTALNAFYKDHNLYKPMNADEFRSWHEHKIAGILFRNHLIAVNNSLKPVAGIGIVEDYLLRTLHVRHMPILHRLINLLFKVLPKDGIIRSVMIEKIWYSEGNLDVAKHLLEYARWKWGGQGKVFFTILDKKSPLVLLFDLKARIFNSSYTVAINGNAPISEKRLIYPI